VQGRMTASTRPKAPSFAGNGIGMFDSHSNEPPTKNGDKT
jgi:hypothetical protein